MRAALLLGLLLGLPLVAAQDEAERIDARVTLPAGGAPTVEGEGLAAGPFEPGARYEVRLNLTVPYTTIEVEAGPGLGLERPRQLVPRLEIADDEPYCLGAMQGACEYPLFEAFPHERIWDVDAPARVFHVDGAKDAFRLRLGVPGPVNATLVLERDVAAPAFTLSPPANVTSIGFYQESSTSELALGDLQVRERGATAWVQNPTPVPHFLQRFPVQGLRANTTYEYRILFEDWAGNAAETPTLTLTTAPEPVRIVPVVTPASPAPNTTVAAEGLLVRATFASPGSPVDRSGVRLFFDLEEVSDRVGVGPGEVAFTPGALEPGLHVVSVEVTNAEGGKGVARWTFTVAGADREAPGLAAAASLLALVAVALARRR